MKDPDEAKRLTPGQIAQIACLLEVTARKPGNVHRYRDFADAHYLDFLLSAAAIVGPLDAASTTGLGLTIRRAVTSTRQRVRTNTNLGMILLLAPLASVPIGEDLRGGVGRILGATTTEDTVNVYRAIRLAKPGGLGKVDEQDLSDEPTFRLVEAMRLAADRDLVARQYENGFAEVFDLILPSLHQTIGAGRSVETAIVATFLECLSRHPDTLIARKRGQAIAEEASARAAQVLDRGWPDDSTGLAELSVFDDWLRADGHARNPGATADLTTAALFAALRDGTIKLPIAGDWSPPGSSPAD